MYHFRTEQLNVDHYSAVIEKLQLNLKLMRNLFHHRLFEESVGHNIERPSHRICLEVIKATQIDITVLQMSFLLRTELMSKSIVSKTR